jgi:hypothetical protein
MKILEYIILTITVIVGFILKIFIKIWDLIFPLIRNINSTINKAIIEDIESCVIEDKDGKKYSYATLGQRSIAHIIDYAILLVPMTITMIIIPFIFPALLALAYNVGFWSTRGTTPGKKFMNLKVVDKNGEFLSVEKGVIRYFGYIISGVFLAIGFFWIYWDPNNQGWHDKFANSFVVVVND